MRSASLPAVLVATFLVSGACAPEASPRAGVSGDEIVARAHAIHDRIVTIDTHDDIPSNFATAEVDPLNADRKVSLEKMRAGGLDVAFFVVYAGQRERTPENYAAARAEGMSKFEAIHRMAEEMYPDLIEIAYTPDDIERIHASGRLATVIGMENGFLIGKDLSLLKTYYDLGGRYLTLAHQGHNDIADSSTPRPRLGDEPSEHGGLSPFGEEVVAEMNRLGMMVDVSHISKEAALDAMRVSRAPVIASHSSTRALADVERNMDDETLLALKDNGGVIQIVALGRYVKSDGSSPATVQDFVDHIDHAVGLIGIDHVGISSDFDGGGGIAGWNDASETFNVTLELVRRGYTEEQIRKLWGGNLLRVWREANRVAASMSSRPGD